MSHAGGKSLEEVTGEVNSELVVDDDRDVVGTKDGVLPVVEFEELPRPQPGYVGVVLDHVQTVVLELVPEEVPEEVPEVPIFLFSAPLNVPSHDERHTFLQGLLPLPEFAYDLNVATNRSLPIQPRSLIPVPAVEPGSSQYPTQGLQLSLQP